MQRLTYTVDIDEEIYGLDCLLDMLNAIIESETDSEVLKSRLESKDEICEIGDWDDEKLGGVFSSQDDLMRGISEKFILFRNIIRKKHFGICTDTDIKEAALSLSASCLELANGGKVNE